ncbi:hypothetical protein AXG93_2035s1650 [Marchantia polymorpha subsp. ruderalis]|uniref:Uncharacterized protein n=1 Tax=Marchantia polymorpha subsp. ruderalis TaxID=1480154 RepID=A0A176VR37_MARPO|nr:hypothetical protein AXG93_2035s1650 [Marchantia polymorpha subsp. ruderalis]
MFQETPKAMCKSGDSPPHRERWLIARQGTTVAMYTSGKGTSEVAKEPRSRPAGRTTDLGSLDAFAEEYKAPRIEQAISTESPGALLLLLQPLWSRTLQVLWMCIRSNTG